MNYLVKNDLVFGVPKMKFSVPDDCIPCKKGKQHKKSHKSKSKNSIVTPLELLHMDLFGPISIKSIGDSKLPVTFCAEAVNTVCHVLNRVLKVKQHNKTCYELLNNRKPNLEYLLPFGNPCTLLKVRDVPTKFSAKAIKGIFLGYVANSTTKRVYNKETRQNSGFLPNVVPQSSVPSTSVSDPNVASCSGTQESDSEDENIPTNLDSEITVNQDLSYQSDTTQVDVLPVPEVASIKELKAHLISNIIGNLRDGVQTRSIIDNTCLYTGIKNFGVLDEEFAQFDKLKVWNLVDLPKGVYLIGTKWVFKCKKNDRGVVVRNKARLVVQGFNLQEGIDYTEVYAPVARLEAIRLFLAFASYKGFKVFQLDVKSAFLYGKVKEEVYVCQPPGFEDPINSSKVFKFDKALYGLHQAPRAWYETLSTHLIENDFVRGHIGLTLFIKKAGEEYLLVQIYVDDIIFASTNEGLRKEFESIMKLKFEMSAMGELSFFLGLQSTREKPLQFGRRLDRADCFGPAWSPGSSTSLIPAQLPSRFDQNARLISNSSKFDSAESNRSNSGMNP
ncbi:hypothetical protein L1987_28117 [Smallanthus sonchifolius]|uniref:Uncharacterized protein n=1 Tax=Smallanthus sonchifolius TaxID=185202 RepID=A0ACB9IDY0_9ASTR|nr:hypothetical protein L1987_28117 [Smallanthus sonchifolius]